MQKLIDYIKKIYDTDSFIPLHEPKFMGNEKEYLNECIDSSYVSSIGKFVNRFEKDIAEFTGSKYAVATVNGTAALHVALILAGVKHNDEVITQPLTFVATCNAIKYCSADPVFIDVDIETMGMCPDSLENFLNKHCSLKDGQCINSKTGKIIRACVPMHTFGHPCKIDKIKKICDEYNIFLIEDNAESLGSYYKNKHTGTYGQIGCFSFNGNKVITAGGGGCIITNDKDLAKKAKHITTTAKVPHKWDYVHDVTGYNYRMPNLNAALLCAQLENLENFLNNKRETSKLYKTFLHNDSNINFFDEPKFSKSNFWLNVILLADKNQQQEFLKLSNEQSVMTRPIWKLMNKLEMYKNCFCVSLKNCKYFEDRIINLPSSYRDI